MTNHIRLTLLLFAALSLLVIPGCYEEKPLDSDESEASISLAGSWESPLPGSNTLYSIWVDPAGSELFAVGGYGTIVGVKQSASTLYDGVTTSQLYAVWGSSTSNVLAVGDAGLALRYNGSSWSQESTGSSEILLGVWGLSSSNVYAVGTDGAILSYDGNVWSAVTSPAARTLYSVWGSSSDDIYAAGLNGIILHFDGTSWDSLSTQTTKTLLTVGGFSDGTVHVFIGGHDGKILAYDGNESGDWSTYDLVDTVSSVYSIWGTALDHLFACASDGRVYKFTGTTWRQLIDAPEPLHCLDGDEQGNIYACGESGVIYQIASDESVSRVLPRPTVSRLRTISGVDSRHMYAAGDNGAVLARSYEGWRQVVQPWDVTILELYCPTDNVIFAAAGGGILMFDGHNWNASYDVPDSDSLSNFVSICGDSPYNVYAAGDYGAVIHFDGLSWKKIETGSELNIAAIRMTASGLIYTAGEDGLIRRYNGSTWTTLYSNSSYYWNGLLVEGSNSIYAVGQSGYIIHFDGTSWSSMTRATSNNLIDIWSMQANQIFAVGWLGTIIYFDGNDWTRLESGTDRDLYGIWGPDEGSFYVAGAGGTIRYYTVQPAD